MLLPTIAYSPLPLSGLFVFSEAARRGAVALRVNLADPDVCAGSGTCPACLLSPQSCPIEITVGTLPLLLTNSLRRHNTMHTR